MKEKLTDGRGLDGFQQWRFGLFLLVAVVFAGVVAAAALQALGVPYANVIGGVGGAATAFLAFSYLYYGR